MAPLADLRSADSLYERDYTAWLEEQARLLRAGRVAELDLANLAEEVEDMGRSERRAATSALVVILVHLLKYRYQAERRTNSWRATLVEHRRRLRDAFADSPSLRRHIEERFAACYADAREGAAAQTGLPLSVFPEACPFPPEQVLDRDYLPD
jgi:hypothetical protein